MDPDEGVGPDGTIVTGARRDRVPARFEPVLAAAERAVGRLDPGVALYLYGSVATGQARLGGSDVDLLTVGLPGPAAAALGAELSGRFGGLCRGVEIGAGQPGDVVGDTDQAYGNRVFLRHYCVQLSGPPRTDGARRYPADARAARGFNGDIATHARRWRSDLDAGAAADAVAVRLARKTLLAVAALVSVRDRTWTTDRVRAAHRWAELDPAAAPDLRTLVAWSGFRAGRCGDPPVRRMLDGTVGAVVAAFAAEIGLWPPDP